MNITVSSRMLGKRLREMRDAAGLTVRVVAAEMEYTASKVTQQEGGYRPVSKAELSHLVTYVYGGDTDTLEALEYLRQRSAEGRGWWTETGTKLPEHFEAFLGLEDAAALSQVVALEIMPGLLQTESYMRAQHGVSGRLTRGEVDHHVAVRMRRQKRLGAVRNPLRLDTVISEGVLRRCGQHPDCDQIPRLIGFLERRLPTVEVRVLPFGEGIHDVTGPFTVLTLPRKQLPPVVHQEAARGGHFIEDPVVVTEMIADYEAIRSRALSPADSLTLMKELLPKG